MKKQITFAAMLFAATLLAGCSNDIPGEIEKEENATSLNAGSLKFNFVEVPFGADVEKTRAAQLPKEEVVDLGNGFEAQISVEPDPAPAATRASKPIPDGTYTIIAYKGTQRLSQQITFKVTGGVTTITSPKAKYSWVSNATYTFICYNEKVSDSGDKLTTILFPTGAAEGLIGRKTITINGADQTLTFEMKHADFRVRTKLITLQEYATSVTGVSLGDYLKNRNVSYDILTGESVFANPAPTPTIEQTYTSSGTIHNNRLSDDLYTVTAKEYDHYLPVKEQTTRFSCGGTLYGKPVSFSQTLNIGTKNGFVANGSYTVCIKLMPRYLYLYEDGQTGYLSDAGRKDHMPVALVYDAAGRRAIALWNAYYTSSWYGLPDWQRLHNDAAYINENDATTPAADQGRHWTWDASGSKDGDVKAYNPTKYPAFAYAGKFYTSNELMRMLSLKGKTLTANLSRDGVWYLPSMYDWHQVYVKLGLGNESQALGLWKGSCINYAFAIADGTSIARYGTKYWASTEAQGTGGAFCVYVHRASMTNSGGGKNWKPQGHIDAPTVRAVITY